MYVVFFVIGNAFVRALPPLYILLVFKVKKVCRYGNLSVVNNQGLNICEICFICGK